MLHSNYIPAVDQGIFYKAANIHSDMINTFVDYSAAKIEYIGRLCLKLNTEKTTVEYPNLSMAISVLY